MGAGTAVAKKTGPKPSAEGPREALIALKCRQAYKDWVVAFAEDERTTPSSLIDLALVAYAREKGREMPPKR